ncbi:hypothetical protein F5Y05DRAFT_339988 [Hypoxylon sp. FL0543]|nr:hypothetical protein F5Y05DRAFT_339988 [Hypoxylon sp. FL0543]
MDSSQSHKAAEDSVQEPLRLLNVRTPEAMASLLDNIRGLPGKPPSLFLDIERINKANVAFMIMFIPLKRVIYRIMIDGDRSMDLTTTSASGDTLKWVLESESIPKIVFDVRHLSHALFRLHNVSLDGIRDLQLMELASRDAKQSKKYVAGLNKCVDHDIASSNEARTRWLDANKGTQYHTFNTIGHAPRWSMKRVELFPALWDAYYARLRRPSQAFWLAQSEWEAKTRIAASQYPRFNLDDKGNALGPEVWYDHEQREHAMKSWNRDLSIGIKLGG